MTTRTPDERRPSHDRATIVFVLWPARWVSALDARIFVPPGAGVVMLDIRIESHYFACNAIVLKDVGTNQVVWRTTDVVSRTILGHASVVAEIPSAVLTRGHYIVDLLGRNSHSSPELVSSGPFQVLSL